MKVYIGSYTSAGGKDTGSPGIVVCDFDPESGKLTRLSESTVCVNPSYLFFSGDGSKMYACCETMPDSSFASFDVDGATGGLTLTGTCTAPGGAMCHGTVTPDGAAVVGANYMGGNIVWAVTDENGAVSGTAKSIQHEGCGPTDRQKGPHAHQVRFGPEGVLYAADLGIDKVVKYTWDGEDFARCGELTAPAGEGPRHVAFSGDGRYTYVITELGKNVLVYDGDTLVQTEPLLPGFEGFCLASEIEVAGGGRLLVTSTRFYDSIVIFDIGADGRLSGRREFDCRGREPRMFALSGDEKYIFIANQGSDCVAVCRFDPVSGAVLEETDRIAVNKASFVKVL